MSDEKISGAGARGDAGDAGERGEHEHGEGESEKAIDALPSAAVSEVSAQENLVIALVGVGFERRTAELMAQDAVDHVKAKKV